MPTSCRPFFEKRFFVPKASSPILTSANTVFEVLLFCDGNPFEFSMMCGWCLTCSLKQLLKHSGNPSMNSFHSTFVKTFLRQFLYFCNVSSFNSL